MRQRAQVTLCHIVERLAKLAPAPQHELVRGMVAELNAIADPAERTSFALGAITAIAHLSLRGYSRSTLQALGRCVGIGQPFDSAPPGAPSMSTLTTRLLLRRHATNFTFSFATLTAVILANYAVKQVPNLMANGASAGVITESLFLALPFIMALTIPMAVFITVSFVFMRLGADGTLASARRQRNGIRRLLAPVLGAAAVIASLALVANTQLLPRANDQLAQLLAGGPREASDRSMTINQLREAALIARTANGAEASARAVAYEVEIQKKFALAAACMVLALVGAGTAIRFPRGGVGLVISASLIVFSAYYAAIVGGEALADRQVISPFVGMWMANAFLLGIGLLLAWRPSGSSSNDAGPIEQTTLLSTANAR